MYVPLGVAFTSLVSVFVFFLSQKLLNQLPDHSLPDLLCSVVKGSFKEKLKVLDAINLPDRFRTALPLVTRQIEVQKLFI